MLNNPPPSPINKDAVSEPLIATDDVNCDLYEPDDGVVSTINLSPLATDAVAEPLAINGDAAACTFVNWEPSPINVNALTLPLTSTLP